jgi:2-methylfumaryl-CoA isomerase
MVREDPRVSPSNPLFERIEQPGIGRYLAAGNPLDFGAAPRGAVARAPVLGEHTDEILLDVLKLGEREVGALHDKGVVAGAVAG